MCLVSTVCFSGAVWARGQTSRRGQRSWSRSLPLITYTHTFFIWVAFRLLKKMLYDKMIWKLSSGSDLTAVYLVWRYFSCVCFTREHHEWLVSNSSWDGETGHPGHKGNAHTEPVSSFIYRYTRYGWYLFSFFCSQSKLCRNKPKASVRSSTWSRVTPRWRSTGKCLGLTDNQTLACRLWVEPGGAGSQSGEP